MNEYLVWKEKTHNKGRNWTIKKSVQKDYKVGIKNYNKTKTINIKHIRKRSENKIEIIIR